MGIKVVDHVGFVLMSAGYLWLMSFNQDPYAYVKSFTMHSYFLIWLFYLLSILNIKSLKIISREALFEITLVQQLLFTPIYWTLLHSHLLNLPQILQTRIYWNIYVHSVPLVLLLTQLYFEPIELAFRWKTGLAYGLLVGIPANYVYTINVKPVYPFLTYRTFADGAGFLLVSLSIIVLIHYGAYRLSRKMRNKVKQT